MLKSLWLIPLLMAMAVPSVRADTLTTTPSQGRLAILGDPLGDTANLSGGSNPTGTITFTLILGGTTVDTETVAVNGNGTYSTPTGFISTGTGTYQWDASYSGDLHNSPASDINDPNEQVIVSSSAVPEPGSISLMLAGLVWVMIVSLISRK